MDRGRAGGNQVREGRLTTYLVTRHEGAVEWAARRGVSFDRHVSHLEANRVQAGDVVIGTLPVHLAAEVCRREARYLHLSIDLAAAMRGRELTADEIERCRARLERCHVALLDECADNRPKR